MDLTIRPRRLRKGEILRKMVRGDQDGSFLFNLSYVCTGR